VFGKLGLDWKKYVKQDAAFLRSEELNNLKGDCSKLKKVTGWEPTYTFEKMLDEMITYWLVQYYEK
jgi:GDPmannose 4,6-dehydratase